jgi:CRP-like cAMP-binding protein
MIALQPGQPETRVARLQAGMFFGEMSVLTGEPRGATIVAATDALAFEITKADLAALVRARPEVAETISQAVAARKLRNSEAAARAGTPARITEELSVAAQLVTKIFSFLGVKRRGGMTVKELEQNASMSPFS